MLGLYCSSWKTHFLPQRASADGVIEFDGGFAEGTQIPIFDVADTGTTLAYAYIHWLANLPFLCFIRICCQHHH